MIRQIATMRHFNVMYNFELFKRLRITQTQAEYEV